MSALEPQTTLPSGWRLLQGVPYGVVGSTWLVTTPQTNFVRLARVLRQREVYRPPFPAGVEALEVDAPASGIESHVVSWRLGDPAEPGLTILETSVPEPVRSFDPHGPNALEELCGIARALARLHAHEVSVNALAPRGIVYFSEDDSAPPAFLDLGLECVAALDEFSDPSLLSRPWQGDDVAYLAPEQIHRLMQRLPSSFNAGSDVYALGVMLLVNFLEANPFQELPPEVALGAHANVVREALDEVEPSPEIAALLEQCLQPDPRARPAAAEIADALSEVIETVEDARRRRTTGGAAATASRMLGAVRRAGSTSWGGVRGGCAKTARGARSAWSGTMKKIGLGKAGSGPIGAGEDDA